METSRIRELARTLLSSRAMRCASGIAVIALAGCNTMQQCPTGAVKTAINAPYAVYYQAGASPSAPDIATLVEDTHDVKERCLIEIKPENAADCVPPRSRAKVIDGKTYCVYP